MMNQMTAAAIKPIPARLPTTPPAMAPALEPLFFPPVELAGVLVGVVLVLVLVRLEENEDEPGRVATGGLLAVDSGSPAKM